MGKLDAFVDVTGQMKLDEVNAENIKHIIDEHNRDTDLLDLLGKGFKIVKSDIYTFPAITALAASSAQVQSTSVAHGLTYVPAYVAYAEIFNSGAAIHASFPQRYYTFLYNNLTCGDVESQVGNTLAIGVDDKNLYLSRQGFNGDAVLTHNVSAISVKYYILQELGA